ncbi:replication initiator protein A [Enterococcus alishanensis]
MDHFKYFTDKRIYNEIYYQFPKAFVENKTYRKLSDGAKIAYMLLKSRLELAMLKNWKDENGHVYFEFTNTELQEMLNCGSQKVSHLKKELEEFSLLKQQRMGFDKTTGKNKKNRLYLAELEVTENDIYLMQKREENLANSGLVKITSRINDNQSAKDLASSGLVKITSHPDNAETLDNSGLVKIKQELNNNNIDTNRHLIDTEKDNLQNQILLENFVETCHSSQIPTFIPDKVLQLIATFSPTYEIARQTVKTIHNAKYKAEQQAGITIVFEELEQQGIKAEAELYQTLLKAYQKNKTEKVKDIQNLIFIYVRNWFIEKPIALIQQDQNQESLPDVSMDSWL